MSTDHFKDKDFWKIAILSTNGNWSYAQKICKSKAGAVNSFGKLSSIDFNNLQDIYLVSIRGQEIVYTKKMLPKIISIANNDNYGQAKQSAMLFVKKRFPEALI